MQQILRLFPVHMRETIRDSGIFNQNLEEIRVRVNQYLMFRTAGGEYFLKENTLVATPDKDCYQMTGKDLEQMCTFMSNYSLYAYEEEIKQGFLTVEGGHRIGVCGQVSVEQGKIRRIFPISYLNIRIANEKRGCAKDIFPYLHRDTIFCNTLILSPPGVGKTTLLRDLVRMLSSGTDQVPGRKVGLVDERSEIAGCIRGMPQNDVGPRTDVLDGCPKLEGMMLLVRSMSPEILAVDEIGGDEELRAIQYVLHCGCKIIVTVHCSSLEELWDKPGWRRCREETMFSRFVVVKSKDGVRNYEIFNENGEQI